MAVLFDPNKKEEDQQNGQEQQVTNPGVVGAPTAGAANAAPPSTPAGTSSGRFANLTGYIKANQGFNKEGGGLGGKINQNISNQGNQVTQNVANAVQNFNKQTTGQVTQAQQGQQAATQVVADPTSVDPNVANQVTGFINSSYAGPNSLGDLEGKENQAALQSQANNFTNTTKQGQTEGGRYNLLRTMFNKPSYTTGQQNLDNLLIQGNKDQLKTLQDSRKLSGQVNQNLNNSIAQTTQGGADAKATYDNSVQGAIGSLTGGITDKDQALAKAAQEAQAAKDQKVSQLKNMINSGQVSQDVLNQLGLSAGQNLYNVDPTSFINASNLKANAQNVGTAQDYARISALGNILGQKSTPEVSALLESYKQNNPEQFQNTAAYGIDRNRLQQSLSDAESGYKNEYNSMIDPGGMFQSGNAAAYHPATIKGTTIPSTGNLQQDISKLENEINHPTIGYYQGTEGERAQALANLKGIVNKYTPNRSLALTSSMIPNSDFGETQ